MIPNLLESNDYEDDAISSTDVVKSVYENLGKGDVPAVLELLDPQIVWREAEGSPNDSGDGWVGHDAVVNNLFIKLSEDWTEFTIHPETLHDAGSVVTVEARYKGTHRATDKDMDCQVAHVWTVKGGKVTRFQQYVDTAKLQDVAGVNQN